MIGVRFKIPNQYDQFLYKILNGIDNNEYRWEIAEDEILTPNGDFLFKEKTYSNQKYKKIISRESYYLIFANIQLYKKSDAITNIDNYKEFQNSNCQLIMFITDNIFVDVYAKNKKHLEIIYRNAINNNFSDIKKINNVADVRKEFSAYCD